MRGEEFVTSLESLTENLLQQLDFVLTRAGNIYLLTVSMWRMYVLRGGSGVPDLDWDRTATITNHATPTHCYTFKLFVL